jgi:hypothetical protein
VLENVCITANGNSVKWLNIDIPSRIINPDRTSKLSFSSIVLRVVTFKTSWENVDSVWKCMCLNDLYTINKRVSKHADEGCHHVACQCPSPCVLHHQDTLSPMCWRMLSVYGNACVTKTFVQPSEENILAC